MTSATATAPCADYGGQDPGEVPSCRPGANLFALRPAGGAQCSAEAALRPGCLVRTGQNFHPYFEVIALSGGKAWIRDVQSGADHVVPLARCRPVERLPANRSCRGR